MANTQKGKRVKSQENINKNSIVKLFNFFIGLIKSHKIISICSGIIVLLIIILLLIIPTIKLNSCVITIDGDNYSVSDFNMYLYSVKYSYLGKDNLNLSEDDLNTQVNEEITVRDYLKEKTLMEIKTAGAIEKIADLNNVILNSSDLKELKNEKEEFIKSMGGMSKFKKLLRDNNTSVKSYDKMAYNDKIYQKIYDSLYSEGKLNDLTDDEMKIATYGYYSSYKKIRQVVLLKIDASTSKSLSNVVINQKKSLASSIRNMAIDGTDFDSLINDYSEDNTVEKDNNYIYYQSGDLLDEIENAVNNLQVGEVSNVIESSIGFHVIIRDELDDYKLNDFINSKREEKLLGDISDNISSIAIIYRDKYNSMKIK